ncbi:FtsX-like permease family protein [Sinomicrobium weinanense]|uniref:FtsX-like permease family protein n=1 Tax=Sinomicrobium weinanense TaxID=2842200 RepID=A0A926JP28_9FLAO|nr:FtsX-like permease family protein [Sinomicrobium weinanense]MBC9794749.1 FtsX-like permease family protein [Sinomicrobium weinanense]MBU3125008.1 FtsX-like permease family protein [Sinomicrobium weinanense]
MIRNYFKIAWRNIRFNKTYSVINIAGLSIGLASFLLVFTVVINEYSYDKQWSKGDRLFRLTSENTATGEKRVSTLSPLAPLLAENFEQVETYSEILHRSVPFVFNEDPVELNSLQVDPGIWDLLDIKTLQGTPQKFNAGYPNLVISEKIRDRYFPHTNPVGKIIRDISNFGESSEYLITGVIEDLPVNTHLRAEALIIDKPQNTDLNSGRFVPYSTNYILLKPGVSKSSLITAINQWYTNLENKKEKIKFSLQPIQDIYLNSDEYYQEIKGNKRNINILTGVAILLLLIACINFVNLSTVRTLKKNRNTGLRKILGASRKKLIFQFLTESFLFFGLSYILGLITYHLFLPFLENFLGNSLALTFTGNLRLLFLSFTLLLSISLLTGIYPAWIISRPDMTHVVSNRFKTNRRSELFRKSLVVAQFVITVGIIISTLVINNQLEFLNQKDLGFNKENLLRINYTAWGNKGEAFKKEIRKIPGVEAASIGQWIPSSAGGTWSADIDDPGSPGNTIKTWYIDADKDLFSTMELEIVKGRSLRNDYSSEQIDPSTSEEEEAGIENRPVLITSYTAERLNIEKLDQAYEEIQGIPVGVIKNFHNQSLRNPLAPTIIRSAKELQYGNMLVRVNTDSPRQIVSRIAQEYNAFYPENLFNYSWTAKDLEKEFRAENKLRTVLTWFSLLIVFLSCLGLFGLITFIIQTRTREISIRKVLGASVARIFGIFSKESLILILIAIIIATPVAWYLLNTWLSGFPYRIEMSFLTFLQSALIVILIALSTIGVRIIRAALKSPAENLRTE